MKRRIKVLLGAGAVAFLVGGIPNVAKANSREDYITNATHGISPTATNEARFNNNDPDRRDWYSNKVKKLDSFAGNRLYKATDDGFTYWTPVRPDSVQSRAKAGLVKGGVSTGEYIYENWYTALLFDDTPENKSGSGWLYRLWQPRPDITRNFKNARSTLKDQTKRKTYDDYKNLGKYITRSYEFNHGGNFKNIAGSWRFSGYANDGSSVQNPFFPPDYSFSGIMNKNWDEFSEINSNLITVSQYNYGKWLEAKENLVRRFMEQNPETKNKYSLDKWMKILVLQTEPELNPATGDQDGKYGGAVFAATHTNGSYYMTFAVLGEKEHGSMNLNLQKLVITEAEKDSKGNYPVVAEITRQSAESRVYSVNKVYGKLIPGKKYRVVSTVKNESKVTGTKQNPTTTNVGYAVNYKSSLEEVTNNGQKDWVYNPSYDYESQEATTPGTIGAGGTTTTVATFTMPDNLTPGSLVRFGSMISDKHREKGDNSHYTDDDLVQWAEVATGNMKAVGVTLVDENGKEVANPLPGQRYKIRYKMKYTGPDMKTKTKVTINYQNKRKLVDGIESIRYMPGSRTQEDRSVTRELVLKNNTTYNFDTKAYQWYEFPWIQTYAVLQSDIAGLNTDTSDDVFSKTWNEKYDLAIENLQVLPRTERDGEAYDGKQHFGVSFNIRSEMPEAAKRANYAQDVMIRINLNGQTKVITEHIVPGENKQITVDMALDNKVPAGYAVNAVVEINPDKMAYESDHVGHRNNKATTTVYQNRLRRDATTGAIINPTDLTNTGGYVAKPHNPYKLSDGKNWNNNWTQNYRVHAWQGEKITYTAHDNRVTRSFYRYTPTQDYRRNIAQWERYEIVDVLFKSKETTENGWGNNGWVSLLHEPGLAQVQAGYGYQIKMIVEYRTNAFSSEPSAWRNTNGSGQFVRPQNVMPNISKDAYFQTSDGKILSASGIDSTLKRLVGRVVTATPERVRMEFTLADNYTMGIRTPGRIYVSEDTPDGMYKVRAFTPVINGIPTKNHRTDFNGFSLYNPSALNDVKGTRVSSVPEELPISGYDQYGNPIIDTSRVPAMRILVVGSHRDDLVDSIIQ